MKLSLLFENQLEDVEITGLALDSRKVKPGYMFFCLKGLEADGHDFAHKAVELGAKVIVHSQEIKKDSGVIYIKSENVLDDLNRVCNCFYGYPSEKLIMFGVTGTNGKSTTSSIISSIFSNYKPCGYMGTIAVKYGDKKRIPTLTTPEQIEVHETLKEMLEDGMEAAAMEVSSHGLSMGRVDSVDFDCGIFTNLSYDHLDYHKTMENYFNAKKILFKNLKKDGVAVLNADDKASYPKLRESCNCKVVTYGMDDSNEEIDYLAKDVELMSTGTNFTLVNKGISYKVKTNLVATYNIYNLLAAIGGMKEMGMDLETMIPLLKNIPQVEGRMEIINTEGEFDIIVDYAHTPDGFQKIFDFAKNITKDRGKIISIFGCAGKRDKTKRKVLGEIAGKFSDLVIVTEEDPRDESPKDIGDMIISGIDETNGHYVYIENREEAILEGIRAAKKDDLVLILGKGDESYMYYDDGRHPWIGDNKAAEKALKFLGK